MRLRRSVGFLVTLSGLAFAVSGGGAGPAQASHGCWTRPSTTIVRTPDARIFRKRVHLKSWQTQIGEPGVYPVVYGCRYRTGATYRLAQLGDIDGLAMIERPVVLAGRFVAYVQRFRTSGDVDAFAVTVRNLETGRITHNRAATQGGLLVPPPVHDLVLKPNGSVAWTATDLIPEPGPCCGSRPEPQVRVSQGTGPQGTVDRGAGIDLRSLELSPDGRGFTYLKDGERRTVPLN